MSTTQFATDTHESEVLFNQAKGLIARNHIPEAMNRLEEALQISPNNALYLSHYGFCVASEREDYPAALKLCERAVELNPKDPIVRVNLGKIYRLKGENAKAHKVFIKAWKIEKTHPLAAAELSRMGIRRPPVFSFLDRGHWLNKYFGSLRAKIERSSLG